MPAFCCIGYPFDFDFLAVYLYRTAVNGVKPEQTAHHFRTPCADQPCKANDFALAYMEGYILKQLTALEVFYLKQRLPNLNILLGIYVSIRRPTISAITSSMFVSSARILFTTVPSRNTVISSAMRNTSSIL